MHFLFDLDGTLGHTLPLCMHSFREAIEPLANRTLSDEDIFATFGPSEEATIRAFLPDRQEEGLARYLAAYERLHDRWPDPFDGMREILDHVKAKGRFVGMITGKGAVSARITLERYGLADFFDCVKTGSPHGPVKQECFDELFRETSLDRADCCYVGDSPGDITASQACGVRSVAAAWAPSADAPALMAMRPDHCFETVPAFREFVERMA